MYLNSCNIQQTKFLFIFPGQMFNLKVYNLICFFLQIMISNREHVLSLDIDLNGSNRVALVPPTATMRFVARQPYPPPPPPTDNSRVHI